MNRPRANRALAAAVGLRVVVTTDKRVLVVADPHCPGYRASQAGTQAATPSP